MIELLCLISDEAEEKIIKPLYNKYEMPFNLATYGEGTASSSILKYFGLEEVKKYIYFSLINSHEKKKLLKSIEKNLKLDEPGNGICFTIPLSSSTKYIKDKFTMEDKMEKKDIDEKKEYHLIVTIITEGFSEEVMNAAKKAGAGGGTLIRGRSLYQQKDKKEFLGFSIEPEKDVVLIVVDKNKKNDVMNSIIEETGLKTKGGGMTFSLPISDAIGLYE